VKGHGFSRAEKTTIGSGFAPVATAKTAVNGPGVRRTEARLPHHYKIQTDLLPTADFD